MNYELHIAAVLGPYATFRMGDPCGYRVDSASNEGHVDLLQGR